MHSLDCRREQIRSDARQVFYEKGGNAMEQLLAFTNNFGFPMVICLYLLVRIEGKLELLAGSINDLSKVIATKL